MIKAKRVKDPASRWEPAGPKDRQGRLTIRCADESTAMPVGGAHLLLCAHHRAVRRGVKAARTKALKAAQGELL